MRKKTNVADSDFAFPHTFHIPVMGTGFTIDTPLRVARYGISSVISLVDDGLIEQMRKLHCGRFGEPYQEIPAGEQDSRARRITAYLNFVGRIVEGQVEALRASPFEPNSEITRYYEMLPESPLRELYDRMLAMVPSREKDVLRDELRRRVVPGHIDVNIMTAVNRAAFDKGERLPPEFADAMAALRGFALSELRSSIVFSAGLNPQLYSYVTQFPDFFPDSLGNLKKQVILKVSDYRSAEVQGKFLARKGVWVSEYRIESGLNCGGHAFATKGLLMGPILEEFKKKREELTGTLHAVYVKALATRGLSNAPFPREVRITAQGGIGTVGEKRTLEKYYRVDGTGWGTPFLLVPEATNVDAAHLEKLIAAGDQDVFLSNSSPLGIRFWNLRTSASEENRRLRIEAGKPGSACTKGFAVSNTEFSAIPICLASRAYQKRKLACLEEEEHSEERREAARAHILAKSCICQGLAGGATLKNGIDPAATPAVCCGPNIAGFSKIRTLREMVDHIYGRVSILDGAERPHMFVKEIMLYADHLREELRAHSRGLSARTGRYLQEFKENLLAGIEYYTHNVEHIFEQQSGRLLESLRTLRIAVESLPLAVAD
jgi:hypothetical protein